MDGGGPELISMSEAARRLGIAPSTLSRQVKRQIVRSHGGKVVLSEVIADQQANIDPHLANRRKAPVALIVASEGAATPDAPPAVATPFTLARTSKEEATAALRRLLSAVRRTAAHLRNRIHRGRPRGRHALRSPLTC